MAKLFIFRMAYINIIDCVLKLGADMECNVFSLIFYFFWDDV